jgi:hypothetical protein
LDNHAAAALPEVKRRLHRVVANCGLIVEKDAGPRLRPPVRIGQEDGARS